MNANVGFVGVHLGAGNHSRSKTNDYMVLCKTAVETVPTVQALRQGESAMSAAAQAIAILENSPLTNAGRGSNLTEDGTVECDAGIMDGETLLFGGVGAVSGIKNPILVSSKLIEHQKAGLKELDRVPPCCMVGQSVTRWAAQNGIETCQAEDLISDVAKKSFKIHKRNLAQITEGSPFKIQRLEEICNLHNEVSDTVGVVVCDQNGNVASAASSGGIALKQCGRLGQAAVFGCGCWAQNGTSHNTTAVAISTSGCGEYLIRTNFAKECAKVMQNDDCSVINLKEFMEVGFLESPFLRNISEKLAGVIVFKCDISNGCGEYLWCHTTQSMCVGYMSTLDKLPKATISRLPECGKPGKTIVVEGIALNLGHCKTV